MPAAGHPIPSPDRNHLPKRIASTTLRTLRVSGFSNGTVMYVVDVAKGVLEFAPGATSTSSASSAFLFLCRCLDAFSSYLTHHAAINLQPPSCTVLYQTSGSSEAVLKSPVMPSSEDHLARSPSIISPSPPAHVFPRSRALPTRPSWVICGHPCGAAPPPTTTSSCARLFRYAESLEKRNVVIKSVITFGI